MLATCALAALLAASCSAPSTSGARIFNVGTNGLIDSLNPFVLTEPEAFDVADLVYPQLVSYGGRYGTTFVGDWASSWTESADGRVWRFHLRSGKWSDGKPLTAADAVWTIRTELRYANGATALVAGALSGISGVSAPNPRTLVITYNKPIGNVLAQLEQIWILPEHIWAAHTADHGLDLKRYQIAQDLPAVSGGPYFVTRYNETGTTVLKANPGFYGPRPAVAAIALTHYTDSAAMLLALRQGQITAVDQVPFDGLSTVTRIAGIRTVSGESATVVALLFNSNPAKRRNRELLSPQVRRAFDLAVDRQSLINVVFRSGAIPWANWISAYSRNWDDPAIKPPPYDPAKANAILDSLGYKRGPDGIRVAPATSGRYAQPAHEMSYGFAVPGDLPFGGSRAEQIIAQDWAKIGVAVHEVDTGDTGASYTYYQGPHGSYQNYDLGIWYYVGYTDPDFMLQLPTRAQWGNYNDTGYNNPEYDHLYRLQGSTAGLAARRAVVFRMEQILARDLPYAPLVDLTTTFAYSRSWRGVNPNLYGYKSFFEQLTARG